MLVLKRKEADKILFPTLGITVEMLRICGNTARIGIEAPADVPILRHEIADLKAIDFSGDEPPQVKLRHLAHAVRRRLDGAAVVLNQLHRHFDNLRDTTAQQLIVQLFGELKRLEKDAETALDGAADRTLHALVVEHDENHRELLGSFLRVHGVEVTTAGNDRDAWNYLSMHSRPDMILLELQRTMVDRGQLVQQIRADAGLAGVKLLAVSDEDPSDWGITIGPDGIDCWVPKPLHPEQLISTIAHELGVDDLAA